MQPGPPFSERPFFTHHINHSQAVTSADTLPTFRFPVQLLVALASPRRAVRSAHLARSDRCCHHPSGQPRTSHLTARHLQPLSLSILGKQTSIPVLLCSSSLSCWRPLMCLADLEVIHQAGYCLLAPFRGKHCMPFCAASDIPSVYRASTDRLAYALVEHTHVIGRHVAFLSISCIYSECIVEGLRCLSRLSGFTCCKPCPIHHIAKSPAHCASH